jgi:hypothetical protein
MVLGAAAAAAILCSLRAAGPADASLAPARMRAAGEAVPFHINSIPSTYPLTGEFRGTYEIFSDSVVVMVQSGRLRSGVPAGIGERGTLRELFVAAGLGRPLDGREGWTTDSLSERTIVLRQLRGEQEGPVPALRMMVRRAPDADLSRQWLFIQVGARHDRLFNTPGDTFVNYACQETNLLGPTPESRARARLMEKAYSTHC